MAPDSKDDYVAPSSNWRQCTANSSQHGRPCRAPAMRGQSVCASHGGRSPQARRAAAVRIAEQKAAGAVERYRPGPVTNPISALEDLARDSLGFYGYAKERVERLIEAGDVTTWSKSRGEEVRALIALFERQSDRAYRQLLDFGKYGLDELKVRIDQAQQDTAMKGLSDAFGAVMTDPGLALTDAQRERLKVVLAAAIDGQQAPPARAGIRGAAVALETLGAVTRRGAFGRWAPAEAEDVGALQRAAAGLLAVLGHPAEPVGEPTPSEAVRVLGPVVDDAEIIGESE